ncbi:stalk domain-containing protein [Paenibacillus lautus]|uniref:stalk domain-containing protein n=1 Tax=Paenibacillus lautus TaxID=1401 RepID=UPI003D2699B8
MFKADHYLSNPGFSLFTINIYPQRRVNVRPAIIIFRCLKKRGINSGVSYAASGSLTATIANYKLMVNGKEENLKNKPVVINGTTYLPVREVSQAVGYNVTLNKGNIMLDNGAAVIG